MNMRSVGVFPILLGALSMPVYAQAPGAQVIDTAAAVTPAPCHCVTIPALTPVSVEILTPLGSKTSRTGDTFPIRLAQPIIIGDGEVVPAGAMGVGEVIHAKKSGGMGAAGELVLAARYVEVSGRRLTLRSLNLALAGSSRIGAVDALNAASAAGPLPIGLIGFFIAGGQVVVPQGTVAQAKIRDSITLPDKPLSGMTPKSENIEGVSE